MKLRSAGQVYNTDVLRVQGVRGQLNSATRNLWRKIAIFVFIAYVCYYNSDTIPMPVAELGRTGAQHRGKFPSSAIQNLTLLNF